jgi:phosphoglycolate phosphatase
MKSPEALIFDLDGTLWDSIDACVAAWNAVLAAHPSLAPVTREDFLRTMGKNHLEICDMYFPSLAFAERSALIEQCYAREVSFFRANPPALYPGVIEGLRRLRRDYKLAIVSNCQREYLDFVLDQYGLRSLIGASVCYEDTLKSKGQNILRAVESLGVKSAFYLGDTLGDQTAATEAEVSFGYAAYGFGKVEWFDVSFESFPEVVEFFSQES